MGTSQAAEYFQFDLKGESKWETEVVGELDGGSTVKFHCTVVIPVCTFFFWSPFFFLLICAHILPSKSLMFHLMNLNFKALFG